MADDDLDDTIDQLTDYVRRKVASGFRKPSGIVADALEVYCDQPADQLRPHAERALEEAISDQRRGEASWPAVTDCDRFDAAFATLEQAGIVCRHDFSCCGTCASGEIWDEIKAEQDRGREIIGCAHYNMQDTDAAVDGGGVYLSYSSVLRGERPSVEIGRQIAGAMRRQGLRVKWDGSLSRRIHVALDWKRRLPTD